MSKVPLGMCQKSSSDPPPPPAAVGLPDVISMRELSDFLRISRTTAYELVASGRLPAIRPGRGGRAMKVLKSDLLDWLQHERGSAGVRG